MSQRAETSVSVGNRLGLHARPAMAFVETASGFSAKVNVRRADGDEIVDGKSIMHMMMLAATKGTELVISAEGDDAESAVASLKQLVDSNFGED